MLDAFACEEIINTAYDNEFVEFADGYRVSRDGVVQSSKRGKWKVLKAAVGGCGYKHVRICNDGKCTTTLVHRIVAEVFLGPCPAGWTVDHVDENKLNNHVSNLQYLTRANNARKSKQGEKNHKAKLDEEDVRIIRNMRGYMSQRQLAWSFGVSQKAISKIQTRKTWKHVS